MTAVFDGEAQTSDGGASLLGAVDRRLGLTESLASCFVDRRAPSRIQHSFEEIFRQRVFSIALGYSDQNDAARVGHDPMLKALSGRAPIKGADLVSQPTLSRFENRVTAPVRLPRFVDTSPQGGGDCPDATHTQTVPRGVPAPDGGAAAIRAIDP